MDDVTAYGNARNVYRIAHLRLISSRFPALMILVLATISQASAHNGPPFAIVMDRKVGPCIISVWTHPDVGIGKVYVMVDPPKAGSIPKDLKVALGIQPVSRRLSEVLYATHLESLHGQAEYQADVNFDAQEIWRVRVVLESSQGHGDTEATVEATPPGPASWEIFWYASPFAAIAFLWFRAITRKRARQRSALPN